MGKGGKGGDSSNIEIFLRVKPTDRPSNYFSYDLAESKVHLHLLAEGEPVWKATPAQAGKVDFNIPRQDTAGYVNNQREHYEYKFNGLIPPDAQQDEVFERVARSALTAVMEGVNSTLFAYGQTGSGKTFTMTGGVERYQDRGLIPRSISAIFSEIAKRSDAQYTVHISYMEIYQDTGYDLLDPTQDAKTLEDLPRVRLMEDEDGRIHLQNLSTHRANSEEDALNLLFLGDTNRTISETPMNMASSRSHCIFTLYVESRKEGGDKVRRSKFHMVDLAGSERVSKTGVDGTTLREAKYINLSLHYLEQVIIALQEISTGSGRTHIPYRNSMMTSVLRDSLGGNCRTSMIATVATENMALDESMSTCRFALRVAMVTNTIVVNEEVDPTLIIKRLKVEIRELKEELRLVKGEGAGERAELTEGEIERLKRACVAYVNDPSPEAAMAWESMQHVRVAFRLFKDLCQEGGHLGLPAAGGGGSGKGGDSNGGGPSSPQKGGGGEGGGGTHVADVAVTEAMKKLRLQVQQRDNEINILVSMLKKSSSSSGQVLAAVNPPPALPPSATPRGGSGAKGPAEMGAEEIRDLLADRNKAFETFRKSYRKNEAIEDNKALLKTKYNEAKALGESVNKSRQVINGLKASIQQRRMQKGVQSVAEGTDPADAAIAPEEAEERQRIDLEKALYKENFNRLRDLKKEIEHLQLLLEQSRHALQGDFEKWLETMIRQRAANEVTGAVRSGAASPASTLSRSAAVGGGSMSLGKGTLDFDAAGLPGPRLAWGDGGAALPSPASTLRPQPPGSPVKVPLVTGNVDADADIAAFYEAKEKLLRARMSQSMQGSS